MSRCSGRSPDRIVVRGEVNNKQEAPGSSAASLPTSNAGLPGKQDKPKPITLLLYSDARRYRAVAATTGDVVSDWGFYLPGKRLAIANIGASLGNLRHELVHPLLGDHYPGIPAWLNEGIASLYGTAKHGKRGYTFLVNYRLCDLQRALAANTLPSLAALAKSTPFDVTGPHTMMYYAYARYVLLYAEYKGALGKLYRDLRASPLAEHPAILTRHIDEQAFRAWALKLRY